MHFFNIHGLKNPKSYLQTGGIPAESYNELHSEKRLNLVKENAWLRSKKLAG